MSGKLASGKPLHVVPRDGGWAVRPSGAERAVKVFGTRHDATSFARALAHRSGGAEVFVHGRDGMVTGYASYRRPNEPPKQ